MNAQELRIGNLVMDGTIDAILYNEQMRKCEVINKNGGRFFEYIGLLTPIPLTEEWLVRFGFEKLPLGYFSNGKLEIGYTTSDEYIQYEYLSVSNGNNAKTEMLDIKYVHTLQNLYFALTSQELTIKEK